MFLLVLCCWIMIYGLTQQHDSAHRVSSLNVTLDCSCSFISFIFTQDANKNQELDEMKIN